MTYEVSESTDKVKREKRVWKAQRRGMDKSRPIERRNTSLNFGYRSTWSSDYDNLEGRRAIDLGT